MLAVVLWLCLGLALPIVVGLYSSNVTTDAVEAAPGDAFSLSTPVVLSVAPGIRIDRGTVAFVDGNGKPLPANKAQEFGTSSPPPQHLRLYNAAMTIGALAASADPAHSFPISPFADVLINGRYETLSLRRTVLVVHGFFERAEILTDVNAEVSLRRRGIVSIKGNGLLRGERVTFDTTANIGQSERRGAKLHRAPLRLSLKGELIEAAFDGRMIVAEDGLELQGQGELSLPSGRGLARWFGALWPSGMGLRDLSVRGQLHFGKGSMTFENAVARMDGNEATGVVGLRLRHPRPLLTGTLAYKSFDAKPYLTSAALASSGSLSWSSFAGGALTVPLGMHLDADMRVSAERAQLGAFELGRIAATVSLKDGRLLADLGNLKLGEGEGGGQITADFTGFTPKMTLRGKLDEVDLAMLSSVLGGSQVLQGRAAFVADLAGSGATLQEILWSMTGKLAVRAQSSGKVHLDLRSLADAARSGDIVGWGSAARGATSFDSLDLRLVLRDGTILTETAELRAADGTWSATGVVNIQSDRVDIRLSQVGPGVTGAQALASPKAVVEVHGALREPRVKAVAGP